VTTTAAAHARIASAIHRAQERVLEAIRACMKRREKKRMTNEYSRQQNDRSVR
jgi:hypothetical protein